MNIRKLGSIGVMAGLLAGGVVVVATPASADPVTGGYAAVGSDTLQDSMNALVNGSSITGAGVRVSANGVFIGSFDAFGSPLIRTKNAGGYFTRPGGSGAGVNALRASAGHYTLNGQTLNDQVDIARSSGGPGANANANGVLVYVPYARDAVSYAYRVPASDTACAASLAVLTKAELTALYSASAPNTTLCPGTPITPRLPQINSGTRSFFTGAIGVSNTSPGTAVPAGDNVASGPQENTGGQIADYQIIPFSGASWIAQSNNAAPNTIAGDTNLKLGAVDGVATYTGTGTSLVPNQPAYDSTTFGRDTYLVVEYARVNPASPTYDANLAKLVDSTQGLSSLVSFNAPPNQPGAVKAKFGFRPPSTTATQRAFATL
ncbi:substrate-binding domain-containing protein [Cellulomonas sp. McL0617]|uniref:substrate-binding domain-containing protein n=1 Tax=Cellulomonas sp. McL0617 TaxID=3415675 RepID=UPI003CFB88A7